MLGVNFNTLHVLGPYALKSEQVYIENVRLEEEYLGKVQGQSYLDYKKNVRRWI